MLLVLVLLLLLLSMLMFWFGLLGGLGLLFRLALQRRIGV